jgi:glutaredoxin
MSEINLRIIIVREGCPFCAMAKKAVNFINNHLDDLKQIQIKDNEEFEIFGSKIHPIIDMFDRTDFDGYPFIYIDGIPVEPAPTDLLIVSLAEILNDDLIVPISMDGRHYG